MRYSIEAREEEKKGGVWKYGIEREHKRGWSGRWVTTTEAISSGMAYRSSVHTRHSPFIHIESLQNASTCMDATMGNYAHHYKGITPDASDATLSIGPLAMLLCM